MPPRWKVLAEFNPLDLGLIPNKFLNQGRVVPATLIRHGYRFKYSEQEGTVLSGPGIQPLTLSFGFYNLWFLMNWVEWSLDKPYTECIDWYGVIDDWEEPGKGFEWYARDGSWIPHIGRSIFERNYWDFTSTYVYEGPPVNMEKYSCIGYSVECDFDHDSVPEEAGLWVRKFDHDDPKTRQKWQKTLSVGFARHIASETAEIHFSNAANVCMGYPPTAALLGLPKLILDKFEADGTDWLDQATSYDLEDPFEYACSCGSGPEEALDSDDDSDEKSDDGEVPSITDNENGNETENEKCDSQ